MRRRNLSNWLWVSSLAIGAVSLPARATITVDGTINESDYGSSVPGTSALATQTINSSFGSNQLDAAYGVVENGYLYLGFTGNFQNSGNVLQIFIDDGRSGGQNTLSGVPTTAGNLSKMNTLNSNPGSTFSPGFNATYALEANASGNTFYIDQFNLISNTASYLGDFALTGGIGNSQNVGGIKAGYNNTNTAGITTDANGGAANQTAAQAVSTGVELGIPLATLGNPTGNILVMADINGSGDSGPSNQFLPGLETGTPSVKKGPESATNPYYDQASSTTTNAGYGFNFANFPNEYFTVPNTSLANGIWLNTGSGTWSTAANWSNNAIPDGQGAIASFSAATSSSTITLDANRALGTLNFNNANSYILAPSDPNNPTTLIMDNGTSNATISDLGGTHYILTNLQLNSTTLVSAPNHSDSVYLLGNISGTGGLITAASSTTVNGVNYPAAIVLGGNNTYTGPTTIQAGNLQLESNTALPIGTALTMNSPSPRAVLDLYGSNATVSSITDNGSGVVITDSSGSSSTLTYAGNNSAPSTFDGTISDSFFTSGSTLSLVISSGSLTLDGTDTFYGGATINNGASLALVSAMVNGASYQGAGDITNNGNLTINDYINVNNNLYGTGTTTVAAATTLVVKNFTQGALVNNGTVTINGSGPNTVGNISGTGTLNVNSQLQITANSGESAMAALNISGTLDITNNAIVIAFGTTGDPISNIIGWLKNGYDSGKWDGSNIISTSVASHPGTTIGYADGNTDVGTSAAAGTVLIRYTWLGDLNLDGVVNNADLMVLKADAGMTNADWAQGDINYDGVVNADDFSLFQLGVAESAGAVIPVPEPSILGLLALPMLALRGRRHK